MDFEPKTWVYFAKTGVDDGNKIVCPSNQDLFEIAGSEPWFIGFMQETSFQRADGYFIIRVDHDRIPYYKLLLADTVVYNNQENEGAFWIWGNILSVDWKNPDCSFVKFKIDHFMTYQSKIDWEKTYAFIEREHIKEDWASDGGNPLFSNMGPAEDFGVAADTPYYTYEKSFKFRDVLVQSPYNWDGEATFDGKMLNGLYSSLNTLIGGAGTMNAYFHNIAVNKETSINNIVGVYGLPATFSDIFESGGTYTESIELDCINKASVGDPATRFNNAKCWSAPFHIVRLISSDGDSKDFNPQWFGNDVDSYMFEIMATAAGGQFGGVAATFRNRNGTFDWKTWADFIVMIRQLPSCPWTGDGFTDWASVNLASNQFNAFNAILHNVTGLINTGAHSVMAQDEATLPAYTNFATSAVEAVTDSIATGLNLAAQINQQKATGAAVNGVASTSSLFDIGQDAWGFKVIYYGCQPYIMQCVDAYFDRFGYRVNRLKKLELENRPYWTFIKTAECHVLSTLGVPYISELMINKMFNRGVTMWTLDKYKSGTRPGDFSKARENRGIKG